MANIFDLISGSVDSLSSIIGGVDNLPQELNQLWNKLYLPMIVVGSVYVVSKLKN
jgi:hypothetical protein